ncbi:Glycosyltransferase Family 4 [Kytococcus aerolatus]|uniref:Glycosyltransferase Family 4 n=1 Tax=Kytococcus aerolatus TaxID=592308 RepID=A0A212TH96_9MICO|nr:glycosyltransferase [Kytococcus aerolatus]SNC65409.1 Glycosyltransferase Family 4 [Kytococcus aerolatus]
MATPSQHPQLRILSLPADHAYVRTAIGAVGGPDEGVLVLPDPPVPGAPAGQWWPSPAWEPGWLTAHRGELDLVHVHFGFEHRTPAQIREWLDEVERLGLPLVVTVHDLDLPHAQTEAEHADHRERLDALVRAAGAVLTLTPGAAREVERLTGHAAEVVPHPRMASPQDIGDAVHPPAPEREIRIGLHLKSLRANASRGELVEALAQAAAHLPESAGPVGVEVLVHREVRDPDWSRYDAELVALLERVDADPTLPVSVRWIEPLGGPAFTAYLRGLDVSVLPHRWGTHSGWLEECLDLGAVPLVPDVGHLAEQGPPGHAPTVHPAPATAENLVGPLTEAVARARAGRSVSRAAKFARLRDDQVETSRAVHRAVYRRLAGTGVQDHAPPAPGLSQTEEQGPTQGE